MNTLIVWGYMLGLYLLVYRLICMRELGDISAVSQLYLSFIPVDDPFNEERTPAKVSGAA